MMTFPVQQDMILLEMHHCKSAGAFLVRLKVAFDYHSALQRPYHFLFGWYAKLVRLVSACVASPLTVSCWRSWKADPGAGTRAAAGLYSGNGAESRSGWNCQKFGLVRQPDNLVFCLVFCSVSCVIYCDGDCLPLPLPLRTYSAHLNIDFSSTNFFSSCMPLNHL